MPQSLRLLNTSASRRSVVKMADDNPWGTAAGLATGMGALPSVFTRNASDRMLDTMLGFVVMMVLDNLFAYGVAHQV
jgi:hypothetical protein